MRFEEYLAEQNLAVMANHHFEKAKRHKENTLHWHKHNARGHALCSQHHDKIGNKAKAAEHHAKSEEHIAAAEKIEDQKHGY